ncbi:MAG: amidase [Betaproteobacteria bacterium]|nr:amidase [Betaproteobacteria bacterium]
MKDILSLSLREVAAAIRAKKLSSLEATRACLDRIREIQPFTNCFIAVEEEEALRAARAADRMRGKSARLGPLHGVPLAHKDMYYRKGRITTGGSKILRNYRPDVTATVVERMQRAGAVWLGNLNMAEFAANPTGHNDHFGHCRNPWNTEHISGGSSSGSGVAVAARACYGSLGSDTGGSVRLPAAANGVVGLKPTYGRISRHGIMPRSWSLDTVGPLTRTVADCAKLMKIIAGADANDTTCSAEKVPDYEKALTGCIRGLKIGMPLNHYYEEATDDVRRCMSASLDVLKSLGARIVELKVPDPQRLFDLSNAITQVESAAIHGRWMRERPQDYSLMMLARTEPGFHLPATVYLQALNARPRLSAEFIEAVFSKVDVLHAPVMPMPVPTIAETTPRQAGDVQPMIRRLTRNNRPANFLGVPSLSVPAGFSANGLPVAFQLMGRPFSEALLFQIGDAYQRVTDWHGQAPGI